MIYAKCITRLQLNECMHALLTELNNVSNIYFVSQVRKNASVRGQGIMP